MIKEKNFLLLMGSQLFSVLGTTVIQFVISLYVLDITHSALLFSVITSLSIIGRIVCLPFCGILADRLSKKRLMIVMDSLYLILSVMLLAATQVNEVLMMIGVLTVLMGMVSAFETPVVQSTIPLICQPEDIPKANGIISSISMLGNILGPVMAGIVYRFEAVYQIFAVCGVLFIAAILCEVLLVIPRLQEKTGGQKVKEIVVGDLKEVLSYLKIEQTIVKIGLVAFLLNLFISSFIQVMIPFIARVQIGVSEEQFGLMNTFFALGSLVGTLVYSAFANRLSSNSIFKGLIGMSLLFLGLTIPLGLMPSNTLSFWLMVIVVTILLGTVTLLSVQLIVYIQLITKQALLGRVMSFIMIISTLASPLGQLMYGLLGDLLSKSDILILIVALTVITLGISWYSRSIFQQMKTNLAQLKS
ncbi:MFS transporter [Enterococcus sp. AZ163]|uniref:MFS transporter n=1 Tax=Enterococcus sp. AZ163 TaxID=2774638 RepID=UPI003D29DCA5